jgi:hypothetical protein
MHASLNRKISRLALISGLTLIPVLLLVDAYPIQPMPLLGFANLIVFGASFAYGPIARWLSRFYCSSLFAGDGGPGLLALHRKFAVKILKLIGLWVEEEAAS